MQMRRQRRIRRCADMVRAASIRQMTALTIMGAGGLEGRRGRRGAWLDGQGGGSARCRRRGGRGQGLTNLGRAVGADRAGVDADDVAPTGADKEWLAGGDEDA